MSANSASATGGDRRVFYAQLGVTVSVMSLCIVMLLRGESASIYLPVLSGCAGYWMPSPQQNGKVAKSVTPSSIASGSGGSSNDSNHVSIPVDSVQDIRGQP